jgi:REP element-mobilizing transposase RayT
MPSKTIKTPLEVDRYYHIYNRGNNRENIFLREEDYRFFLQKYTEMVHPYVNTYAYCLIPNHFHFMIKFEHFEPRGCCQQPSHYFRKFFQYYAVWYNKTHNRRGSLFTKYYRRIEVSNDDYLRRLIYYIHMNPVKHGITKDFKSYAYSSFGSYVSYEPSMITRSETLSWFNDDLHEFLAFHNIYEEKSDMRDFIFDEAQEGWKP